MSIISLRKNADFLRLKKSSNKFFTKIAVIVVANTPHIDNAILSSTVRTGFIVTKKIGIAVQRNRVRRRLKEAFKKAYTSCQIKGFDIIVIAKKDSLSIKFIDIVNALVQVFQKLKVNNENI